MYLQNNLINIATNKLITILFVSFSVLLSGCGAGGGAAESKTGALTPNSIAITPISATVAKGQVTHFTATATYSDASTADITNKVSWSSANTAVATVGAASGDATGVVVGSTTVTATLQGITSLTAGLTVTNAALSGISISPSTQSTPLGTSVTYIATGSYSDNTSGIVSGSVTWSSSNAAVSTINSTGLATTLLIGTTNISASSNGLTSNIAALTVIPPPAPSAPLGVFAVSASNQVTLSWLPATGAKSYNIYWGVASGITTASNKINVTSSPYLHTGLANGSTYYYRISSVNEGGETLSNETFSYLYTGGNPTGSFSSSGSMSTVRQQPTSLLMPNGKVLIIGGNTAAGQLSSAEIYNPATGNFSSTGSMAWARTAPSATLLPNGKVLIAGGGIFGVGGPSAELYDPVTGTFSSTGNMSITRNYHTATLLPNGKVLVIGGYNGSSLASAELYDPMTGIFTQTGAMAIVRYAHTATLLPSGKVLVTGGGGVGGFSTKKAEIYDPATGSFSPTGDMTTERYYHNSILLVNGKVFLAGGGGSGGSGLATTEIYDPATGIFSASGSMSTIKIGHTSTLLPNGKVLVAGGSATAIAELYDPASGSFSVTGNMASKREYHTATLLPNGKVLITGGWNGISVYYFTTELFQ